MLNIYGEPRALHNKPAANRHSDYSLPETAFQGSKRTDLQALTVLSRIYLTSDKSMNTIKLRSFVCYLSHTGQAAFSACTLEDHPDYKLNTS